MCDSSFHLITTHRLHVQVIELFTTDDKFTACVEAIAGNKLFHVVVDNDTTASVRNAPVSSSDIPSMSTDQRS